MGSDVTGGNGNGVVDVNECNNLFLTLSNRYGSAITGLSARVISLTPGAEIYQGTQSFADVPVGSYTRNTTPFLLSTVRSLPGGTMIQLQASITWTGGSKTVDVEVPVGGYTFYSGTGYAHTTGTTSIGLNFDDAVKPINLPFPVTVYNTTYSAAYVSSNGNIQFESSDAWLAN